LKWHAPFDGAGDRGRESLLVVGMQELGQEAAGVDGAFRRIDPEDCVEEQAAIAWLLDGT
jgi:hypothetical protein